MIQTRLKTIASKLSLTAYHAPGEILEEGLMLVFWIAFELEECKIPREKAAFERLLMDGKPRLINTAEKFQSLLGRIVDLNFDVQRRLGVSIGKLLESAVADIRTQIQGLLFPGYLSKTPAQWLFEMPRYLQAILLRLDKLAGKILRDQEQQRLVNALEARRRAVLAGCPEEALKLDDTKWLLEELRVSLFAQTLGTRVPVSEKRVLKRLEDLERAKR